MVSGKIFQYSRGQSIGNHLIPNATWNIFWAEIKILDNQIYLCITETAHNNHQDLLYHYHRLLQVNREQRNIDSYLNPTETRVGFVILLDKSPKQHHNFKDFTELNCLSQRIRSLSLTSIFQFFFYIVSMRISAQNNCSPLYQLLQPIIATIEESYSSGHPTVYRNS